LWRRPRSKLGSEAKERRRTRMAVGGNTYWPILRQCVNICLEKLRKAIKTAVRIAILSAEI
jgi:hypothetical protein